MSELHTLSLEDAMILSTKLSSNSQLRLMRTLIVERHEYELILMRAVIHNLYGTPISLQVRGDIIIQLGGSLEALCALRQSRL